ncbi:MAG TPA: hypothetical protein VE528_05790 [Thermoleophilaceae bacterium]|nr:hypothetical protein [Thermoleophilaceae bacterium]
MAAALTNTIRAVGIRRRPALVTRPKACSVAESIATMIVFWAPKID